MKKILIILCICFLGIGEVNAVTITDEENNQEKQANSFIDSSLNENVDNKQEDYIGSESEKDLLEQNSRKEQIIVPDIIENNINNLDQSINANKTRIGIQNIDGKNYYFDANGEKQYGFQEIDGKKHFFSRIDGAQRKGLFGIDGDNYYFTDEGMQIGLQNIDGNTYLFNNDGKMLYGFQEINGKKHFFSRINGAQRKGLFGIDGDNYYFIDAGMQIGLQNIDGNTYLFNNDGKMLYGFQEINGKKHFFSRMNGAQRKGLFGIDGDNYYFTDVGMQIGLQNIDGNTYLFNNDGKMLYGFQEINGKTHFFSRLNGAQRKGLFGIDGDNYYFKDEGMQTGIQIIEGNTYYFNSEGKMQYGFQTIEGKTHFFSRLNGAQRKGIFGIDGYIYYFKDEGMQKGLQHIDGADYFFGQDGKRKSGFQIVNGKKNFFSRIDGKKRYGWIYVDGYSYYLDTNGIPVTGSGLIVEGLAYNFDGEGRMIAGWIDRNGYTYYLDNLKNPLTGWHKIAGEKCYFNSRGELIKRNAKLVIDVSSYQGYIDWDTIKRDGLVDGVILRVGWGSYHYESDKWLTYTINALHRLGIPYGIYHFSYASEAIDGYEEADSVVYVMRKYGMNPTLGIYYDIEDYANDGHGFTSDWITKELYDAIITTFMTHMNANGYTAYVYASYNYVMNRFNDHTRGYVGWVAQWGNRCYYNGYYHMWQYSGDAGGNYLYINGINGIVDGNVYFR